MKQGITLTMKEKKRYEVIRDSLGGLIKVKEAAELLGLSERQIYRLRVKVREEGIQGVVHHLRGKESSRKKGKEITEKIKKLYKEKYFGFNISHFTEYLNEEEEIEVSREFVRKELRGADEYPRKPKRQPKHRTRREPMPQEGLMVQLDTSEHLWIPSMDKRSYLILLVDDATNKLLCGKFVSSDSTFENMRVLDKFFTQKGLPGCIYLDKDSKFKTQRHKGIHYNVKGGDYADTQIKRAMDELGIKLLYANSPQAKGRIERDFQTLQDRLLNELKLNDITTLEGANNYIKEEFIIKWNKKFARRPKREGSGYRDIPGDKKLEDILCRKEGRTVYPDNTVSYDNRKYQILADSYRASYAKAKVEVYEHLDNKLSIVYKGRKLKFKKIKTYKKKKQKEESIKESLLKGDISTLQKT